MLVSHAAPYDFVPTAGELQGNKWRMRLLREIPDASDVIESKSDSKITVEPQPVPQPAAAVTRPETAGAIDIRKYSGIEAITFVEGTTSLTDLDLFYAQECENKPRVRSTVLKAIENRRVQLSSPGSVDAMMADLSQSETNS